MKEIWERKIKEWDMKLDMILRPKQEKMDLLKMKEWVNLNKIKSLICDTKKNVKEVLIFSLMIHLRDLRLQRHFISQKQASQMVFGQELWGQSINVNFTL
jgi:hypothetical protein